MGLNKHLYNKGDSLIIRGGKRPFWIDTSPRERSLVNFLLIQFQMCSQM